MGWSKYWPTGSLQYINLTLNQVYSWLSPAGISALQLGDLVNFNKLVPLPAISTHGMTVEGGFGDFAAFLQGGGSAWASQVPSSTVVAASKE